MKRTNHLHRDPRRGVALDSRVWAMLAVSVVTLGSIGCGGGGGPESNGPAGYGVTSNVGTLEEDELQNESPNQDPFADNPDPIPN